jgi:DNA-binding response OmpR family regulator
MKRHILVIDDDPVLLTMTREYLEEAGYKVYTADCGIYSNHIIYGIPPPPDLIVLDIIMSLMSGVKRPNYSKNVKRVLKFPSF